MIQLDESGTLIVLFDSVMNINSSFFPWKKINIKALFSKFCLIIKFINIVKHKNYLIIILRISEITN